MRDSSDPLRDDELLKIQMIAVTLQKTKDELIQWTLRSDNDGDTALHLAVVRRDNELCIYLSRLLLTNGYNLNLRNNLMQTPLHLACVLGNISLLEGLLELDESQLTYEDRNGDTCLHLAIKFKADNVDILRNLLSRYKRSNMLPIFIDAKNYYGQSALHVAASINKPEAIRLLVVHGAEIDQPDTKSGKTPLYIAVEDRNLEAAEELLELGGDANQLTHFRDSPSQLATTKNRRQFLQLISKHESSSAAPVSPTVGCRKYSRRDSGMVNQDFLDSNAENTQMTKNEESPNYGFKSESGTLNSSITAKGNSRRASIIDSTKAGEPPRVKREATSPKGSAPTAYPVSVIENTMTRPSESETGDMQTSPDQMSLSRERRQFLLPPALAVSLYNQHIRSQTSRSATWNSLMSPAVGGVQAFSLPHSLGLPQANSPMISDRRNDNQKGMTTKLEQATETACVTDESSIGTVVSKRTQQRETCFSAGGGVEPLDLSQPEDEAAIRVAGEDRGNMLLEGKMDSDGESPNTVLNVEVCQVHDEVRHKVKKEIVEENANEPSSTAAQQETRGHQPEKPAEQTVNLVPNFLHSTPNALAFVNHWLNFPTVLNPRTHFLQHGYGFIPAAFPATNQPHPLTALDPTVGFSQFVNLSMSMARAADSLRYPPKHDRSNKIERKRKVSEVNQEIEATQMRHNEAEVTTTENPICHTSSAVETPRKRCRLNESTEGLHRSVSDDPGKRRSNESQTQKTKLRRRNSAPLAGASDSDQEGGKKGAPVDLHSYAGCLPPQCLHLLHASGNLSLADASGGDRISTGDVTDLADDTAKNVTQSNPASSTQRVPLNLLEVQDDHYRKAYLPNAHNGESLGRKTKRNVREKTFTGKINATSTIPIIPKSGYFSSTNSPSLYLPQYLFQKAPTVLPFVQNPRTFHASNQRKRHESASEDDDEHIQTLQISDASSDEEDDIEVKQTKSGVKYKSSQKQTSKLAESIGFGKGPWADLDSGSLTAFGSFSALSSGENRWHLGRQYSTVPTKMACTVSKSFPQALNGLTRLHSAARNFKTDRKNEKSHIMLTAEEFRPHSEVTGPAKEFSSKLLNLPTATTLLTKKKQNTTTGSAILSKTKQSEQKLIGDIFQKSFRNPNFPGHNTSSPRCVPRLVFTSEVKPFAGIKASRGGKGKSNTDFDCNRPKATTSIGELRHIEIPQTSAPEYSHKLFSFARSTATKEGDNYNADSVRSIVSQGSSEKSVVSASANERKRSSLFSHSALPFQPATSRARGSSTTSRLGTLDAKIGELRQKATAREEQKAEVSEGDNSNNESCGNKTKMQTVTESMHFAERPSPPLNAGLESRYRSTGSPFYDNDVGRFGKRNIAVIKPNQSVLDGCEKKTLGSTCPPKKRHMKRYSPEIYSKPKADPSLHDREVRSASPIPHPPFVSTNVLINNDEHSLNVQWCSPERSPNRRKPLGSKATTILTLRGANVTLERNLRKYPRYVSSPRSDAVIVVQSRMAGVAMDERDQRLEIEDLEISDDEGQS